jgi:hypothetical protein
MLLDVVDLPTVPALIVAVAGFVGVEAGVLGLAFVAALQNAKDTNEHKQASVLGAINALVTRVGCKPPFDLSHLPDRQNNGAGVIVGALVCAALVFNLSDALGKVPALAAHVATYEQIAGVVAGLLGPILLYLAGHRAAHEVITASARRQSAEAEYTANLEAWRVAWSNPLDTAEGKEYLAALLAEKARRKLEKAGEPIPPELENAVTPFGSNGKARYGAGR